jgi:hypothetical protein
LPTAGCHVSPKDRLQGKWVGQQVDDFQRGQAERALGWAMGATFEFNGSRATVSIPAESPRQGTFRVDKATEDELHVKFLRPHGAEDVVTFRWEQDGSLRWMLPGGSSVLLRKVDS